MLYPLCPMSNLGHRGHCCPAAGRGAAAFGRVLAVAGVLFLSVLAGRAALAAGTVGAGPMADMVVIYKAARELHLLQNGERIRSYRIALGRQPRGDKVMEGDSRTPEGAYMIDWRNPNSNFYLSLHISYPRPEDVAEAAALGVHPGNNIMIHGLPNGRDADQVGHPFRDWTDGCIAVTNEEMEEIWNLVPDGTPIYIFP